jgi:hypothetical protein
MIKMPVSLCPLVAKSFADEFRDAREAAQRDAEGFDQIIYAIERLGSFLLGRIESLDAYRDLICEEAGKSPLGEKDQTGFSEFHVPFEELYELVKVARNDAMHQGAFARRLTEHSIQLSLVLEDALRRGYEMNTVRNYMVRNPICGELWQPISFLRQTLLVNAFSYLPVMKDGKWHFVADLDIAAYLGLAVSKTDRKKRLATMLCEATSIKLRQAKCCLADTSLSQALRDLDEDPRPLLVERTAESPSEIIGILAPSDLL